MLSGLAGPTTGQPNIQSRRLPHALGGFHAGAAVGRVVHQGVDQPQQRRLSAVSLPVHLPGNSFFVVPAQLDSGRAQAVVDYLEVLLGVFQHRWRGQRGVGELVPFAEVAVQALSGRRVRLRAAAAAKAGGGAKAEADAAGRSGTG